MQNLNHADIDRDHQHFSEITSRLKSSENGQFKTLFSELLSHTEKHFKREEQLIEQYNYPGKNEHCGEHNRLLTELRQFNQRVQQGRLTMARAYINERVDEWLHQHIANMDAALVKHLEKHL
ncbi:bacteriohemerythrin [Amphritea sp.]|uniref:bacteriohemerythrin n=1 Tax=Amphritea sp. TaxID=1872502 RepID=UPI003D118BC0